MTDPSPDVLGLGGTVPGPGWMVLDAARDRRFTGELVADDTVRVYFDRGRVYLAERASDPPLGVRLVEAGAISQAQLEYGTLRIGDIEHLGRLFDRVPSVNRDGILALNELMTHECVRALAAAQVRSVTVTPYRHHPSGMHRWGLLDTGRAAPVSSSVPEMAFPAPHPDARPVATSSPAERVQDAHLDDTGRSTSALDDAGPNAPRRSPHLDDAGPKEPRRPTHPDDAGPKEPRRPTHLDEPVGGTPALDGAPLDPAVEDLVTWNEPARSARELVETATTASPRPRHSRLLTDEPTRPGTDQVVPGDVADAGFHAGATQSRLRPPPIRPIEQFEVVWPSGETDDVDDTDQRSGDGEPDRARPTAQVPTNGSRHDRPEAPSGAAPDGSGDFTAPGDNQLAIRRAVATIDTGSLDARRRLADVSSETAPQGRAVVPREAGAWRGGTAASATSGFDDGPLDTDEPDVDAADTDAADTEIDDEHAGRSNALHRLIESLKRS